MSATPKKIYYRDNICVLCGFSFIQKQLSEGGEEVIKKFTKSKLRLVGERVEKIKLVVPFENEDVGANNNGVCLRCFANVEKTIKLTNDLENLRDSIAKSRSSVREMMLSLPSPAKRQIVSKRMSSSPHKTQTAKAVRTEALLPIVKKSPVKLLPLKEIMNRKILPKPAASSVPLPQPRKDDPLQVSDRTRRSLFREGSQPGQDFIRKLDKELSSGEVKVTVYYPSGKKSSFVEDETQKGICKSLVRMNCTNKMLLDHLTESNPTDTVTCASKVIATQCKSACKKTSGSLLMKKTHKDLMNFQFEALHEELKSKCPALVAVLASVISDHPIPTQSKTFRQLVMTAAVALQGRFQDMSAIQYIIGFILTHGGCTQKDIQRLAHVGLTLHPKTLHQKLASWQINLSEEIMKLKESWADGGQQKYQLVGDNWDKNILPSYRTSDRKTLSLHLFNMYAVVDRVVPQPDAGYSSPLEACQLDTQVFIPSESEQKKLLEEMKFLVSTSLVSNHPELGKVFNKIYPKHLQHSYSQYAGEKTKQYPIGLFDCNENKTQEVIKLLSQLTDDYVPFADGDIVESVFLGGDRLTDERVQGAQQAMQNGSTPKDRLEGFVSKTEDFHRLMNFLEAIHKLTYDTRSVQEKGSVHYYRNMLNMRNAKGPVRNAYRPYKMLYYIIWDALCLVMFLEHTGVEEITTEITYPDNFEGFSSTDKIKWLDDMSEAILKQWFFENTDDIFQEVRDILEDPDHPENYWCSTLVDGRVKCHLCEKTYARVATLQAHESKHHGVQIKKPKKKTKSKTDDQVQNYVLSLFKMLTLHKNLDTAVDMADGERSVRSAKYELPLYNRTNKVKYTIGSIHLTALTSGMLPKEQTERLMANRTVNIQGGKNRNIALDEYLEMLNRDSKVACGGYKTKESIILHSKEYPHLTQAVRHFEQMTNMRGSKGFHHLPNYHADVIKVAKDLQELRPLQFSAGRTLNCKNLITDRSPFEDSATNLAKMIHRHKPLLPFRRLRSTAV